MRRFQGNLRHMQLLRRGGGRRIKTPQDCRRFKVRMRRRGRVLLERSRKSGKRSFGEQAEHDASSCRDAIWLASDSMKMENDTFLGRRSAGHFSNKKQLSSGSRSIRKSNEPNQAVELTPTLVTSCACAHLAPSACVAHL